ncbi:MAG: HNH endonuclease signature motif containing protein [Geminicoccaceae bacterium]
MNLDTVMLIAAVWVVLAGLGSVAKRRSPMALPWKLTKLVFRLLRWLFRKVTRQDRAAVIAKAKSKGFSGSRAWQKVRIECIERDKKANGGKLRCSLCGQMEIHGVGSWHCHHIKSRSNYPELALTLSNLAMLCESCNLGMSNRYEDLDLNRCERKYG